MPTLGIAARGYDGQVSASLDIAPDAAGLRLARVEFAAALRAAALYGFNEGIDNHFSLAVPGKGDCFLLNPYGPHWSELRASDLLTISLGGERLAGDGELDVTAFTTCLDSRQKRSVVARDVKDGRHYGVSGTPTFFINGRILIGAQPVDAFRAYIDPTGAASSSP